MKIGFLVGDIANISGGSNVILEYASRLQDLGHEAVLITPGPVKLTYPLWHPRLADLPRRSLAEAEGESFDFALATWWITFYDLWRVNARVYGYLNQSLESRFHAERHYKLLNRQTYSLPLLFVTEAKWLVEFIQTLQPEGRTLYVQNGLSRDHFPCVQAPPKRDGKLRVLVEGPWGVGFKGVPETFEVLELAAEQGVQFETGWLASSSGGQKPTVGGQPVQVHERIPINQVHQVYGQYDVLLKLSRVEGMFGPPLEMFSQGGTAITYTVTGTDEYMVHGQNSLMVEPYNHRQIVQFLRLLSTQPAYLAHLRTNALATAKAFTDWESSTRQVASGLEALHAEGWTNTHLRPALAAMSTMHGHWLDDVWRAERGGHSPLHPYVGPGEQVLLERYRQFKKSRPVRALQKLVGDDLKKSLRARLTRVLS
ncbi:glycosyltransferase family 1 protein [Corallococcus exercitus]|uniref:Glycosyltransferase family 4 protein n=1 Tax=Corallococcus exercitus TaxID=2316736 RepID=A0A3A8IFQ6_9BACT|nr:glycosyltransferase family 4 protein [Corallococcus exercitus]NOK35149.1 glycosyltransferase family 4 protein [Corallococcus exercitus]RKG78724.1 glycosyltransferase family 1 protein [Corallococcus exercitus]